MLMPTHALLRHAQEEGYAVGAFNVYNLEGARAVVAAAEESDSPVLLQLHPGALERGGAPLVALCLAAAREATVPMAVHLDHSAAVTAIEAALEAGFPSVMADGSHLAYADNVAFTAAAARLAHARGATVEAELGRLAGTEDGLTVAEYEARLTDPAAAADFVARTGADALAVCIGNVHGHYRGEPHLDFERLAAVRAAVAVPLVLHGASGLPEAQVRRAIALGVCKLNVNTEVRAAYVAALRERLCAHGSADGTSPDGAPPDLLGLMQGATAAMQAVALAKLRLFGAAGQAGTRFRSL